MHMSSHDPRREAALSRRSSLFSLLMPAAALALGGCAGATKTRAAASPAPEIPERRGASVLRPDGTRVFRNHTLVDQDGRTVRFQDDLVAGQAFAATFQYAKCKGICKNMTEKMKGASDILGETMDHPIRFYIFSLAEDSPADMKRYMQDRGIYGKPGWRFLSAPREVITDIRWAFGSPSSTMRSTRTSRRTPEWSATTTIRPTSGLRVRRSAIRARSRC
jgi:cytochrome oxidase Cu insertion factor (SCO1/SenC/PrrC family)